MFTGYKKGLSVPDYVPVIITIKIPVDAQHNVLRQRFNKDCFFAKHRCSKCIVMSIVDPKTNKIYESAISNYQPVGKRRLQYKVGEVVKDLTYDKNPDKVCSGGIHFFLSFVRACMYRDPFMDSDFQVWFDNGKMRYRAEVDENGKSLTGLFVEYNCRGEVVKQTILDKNRIVSHLTVYIWRDFLGERVCSRKITRIIPRLSITNVIPELSQYLKY